MDEISCQWDLVTVLSEAVQCEHWAVNNTVQLLDDDNTVPFIARYRKEKTNAMEADKIREVKEQLDFYRAVQKKVSSVYNAVKKLGKVTKEWKQALSCCQNLEDVDHLYAPFKPGSQRTLAERARELGLEPLATEILSKPRLARQMIDKFVNPTKKGLESRDDVKKGAQHIIADVISKHKDIISEIRLLCKTADIRIKSTKAKVKETKTTTKSAHSKTSDSEKFELYYDFDMLVRNIKPHQVLAINRGVAKKVLTMKIVIPECASKQLCLVAERFFMPKDVDAFMRGLIDASIQDAYNRLIEPLIMRNVKAELTKNAEKASVDVFAANLKRLLLTPTVSGHVILGIDPGFTHGCKYAVISQTGQVLTTGVVYPHGGGNRGRAAEEMRRVIQEHHCEIVGIGNGTACRETETFFAEHIGLGTFKPHNVQFCIVNESGASIYSASPEAKKEMPDLDVSLRGAVSIARRLQDPMAELVKIEPKHIGVGMYQHDVSEALLKTALYGVVQDCVSFVGVDLNVASEALLKHIAGLTAATAKKIVDHREKTGPFLNREQLKAIKGLGPKSFKQCAGFVRVMSVGINGVNDETIEVLQETVGKKRKSTSTGGKPKKIKLTANAEPNPLDMTIIHPESYEIALGVIADAGAVKEEIGTKSFINTISKYSRGIDMAHLAQKFDCGIPTMTSVFQALQQSIGHDIREAFQKPLFKKGLQQLSDLAVGDNLCGRVTNVVHFGAFVDVGVGRDGLIHSKQMNPGVLQGRILGLGDRVEVKVCNIDSNRGRLGLSLVALS